MRTWAVPFEERDVATGYGTTHIVVCGPASAPPLVLLHGAATTAAMWASIIAPLSESYRCYCVDTITDANKSVGDQAGTRGRGLRRLVTRHLHCA